MTEPAFREIQLSTKQIVFLFIASVVVLVVVFLLGVSVGRGVDSNLQVMAGGAAPGDTIVPTEPLEAPGAVDTGGTPPSEGGGAAEAGEPPDMSQPSVDSPETPPAPPPPAPPPPDPDPQVADPPPPDPAPALVGEWAVQVGAFGSRENAESLISTLRLRGYPVFLEQTDSTTVPFSVRVGPYASRAQAETASDRLSDEPEGYRPLIVR